MVPLQVDVAISSPESDTPNRDPSHREPALLGGLWVSFSMGPLLPRTSVRGAQLLTLISSRDSAFHEFSPVLRVLVLVGFQALSRDLDLDGAVALDPRLATES